jgi:hypothetical protein
MDVLGETREVLRNDALIVLFKLTKGIARITRLPSKLLISSYFWEKTFFCGKLSYGYSMIFSGIEVCTAMA